LALEFAKKIQDRKSYSSQDLFAGNLQDKLVEPSLKDVPEWTNIERLEKEKDVLNFYVSGHPLHKYNAHIQSFSTIALNETDNKNIGSTTRICGMITDVRTRLDRKNNTIGFITIEDFKGKAEGILWSDSYNKFKQHLMVDKVILCEGKTELDENIIKIIIDRLMPIEDSIPYYAKGYQIWIDLDNSNLEKLNLMNKHICNFQNSSTKIKFNIRSNKTCYIADNVNIKLNQETFEKLAELFGESCVGFITE
jgi:DNA polymerase-3 subunit alpha